MFSREQVTVLRATGMGFIVVLVVLSCVVALYAAPTTEQGETNYQIGRGIADSTGPVAEINMMGYVKAGQNTEGIHLRLFSRAFIISNPDGTKPVVFVCVDAAMIPQLLKIKVLENLAERYGSLYTDENVLLSATHTHSGPGGYMQYVLYQFTSFGFFPPSLEALVDGVTSSIINAHDSMQAGNVFYSSGELHNASINRSPTAYLSNPLEEIERYDSDKDDEMVVLKLVDADGNGIGMINWFPVHATSMNNSNHLISSDNKGYASILFETDMNSGAFPGEGSFVAAFAQSNHGDISPNIEGARCQETGEYCDILGNTCEDGTVQDCIAAGPGEDMFESTRIIAERQYAKALEIYNSPGIQLSGPIDFRLRYVNMTNVEVNLPGGNTVSTCKPAIGYSTAAGTADGPGGFDFTQGDLSGDPLWNFVASLIKSPSAEILACQDPKPILLPTGEITTPYLWQAQIADFQLFRVGQLVIVGVPGELSTMAGRRVKEGVLQALLNHGYPADTGVVVTGLANSYINYITTYEEYQVQRYEGASTMYGPHTLNAITQTLNGMAEAMAQGDTVVKGSPPPNLEDVQVNLNSAVILDAVPLFQRFGGVTSDVRDNYQQGETVTASFRAGHPRNSNPRTTTYMAVEKLQTNGAWTVALKDSHWNTKFRWERTNPVLGHSLVHLTWDIADDQSPGTYRLVHNGHKKVFGMIRPYSGLSSSFTVSETPSPARSSPFVPRWPYLCPEGCGYRP